MNRENPFPGQTLAFADIDGEYNAERVVTADVESANLITSMVAGSDTHKPVIDLDLPAKLVPSSTPGHFHLFIDKEMTWEAYVDLLEALVKAGLIEPGYVDASRSRGHTAVRLPWIRKGEQAKSGYRA